MSTTIAVKGINNTQQQASFYFVLIFEPFHLFPRQITDQDTENGRYDYMDDAPVQVRKQVQP